VQSTLAANIQHVERHGFINYFGFQRVGRPSSAVRPHHIGEKMVAGKWSDALQLLLAISERDPPVVQQAKQLYLEQGDVDGALKLLPMSLSLERTLLQVREGFCNACVCAYQDALANSMSHCWRAGTGRASSAMVLLRSSKLSPTSRTPVDSCTCTRTRASCSTALRPSASATGTKRPWKATSWQSETAKLTPGMMQCEQSRRGKLK